jgi:hypothetical protein
MEKLIIKEYVEKLVIGNPKLYGGDYGNNAIAEKYVKDVGVDYKYSTMERVVHRKNVFLTENPQYDFRVKNKGKNTGTIPTVEVD